MRKRFTLLLLVLLAGFTQGSTANWLLLTGTGPDSIAPVAVCKDTTIFLDSTGMAVLTAADIDGGSVDNCGIATRTIKNGIFDCQTPGANTATLIVADTAGNADSCDATVTVWDFMKPVPLCQDTVAYLDVLGNAPVDPAALDAGSYDNCGIGALNAQPAGFDCADLGMHSVSLIVHDIHGNTDSCSANVTVSDTLPPSISCPGDITQAPDSGVQCTAVVNWAAPSASENCGTATLSSSHSPGDTFPGGTTTVVYTAQDSAGNTGQCTFTVTITSPPLNLQLSATDASCPGTSDGAIDLTVVSGTQPFGYAWSTGDTTEDVLAVGGGTHSVTVTDADGCTGTDSVVVGYSGLNKTLILNSQPLNLCQNGSVVLRGIPGMASYAWSNGDSALNTEVNTGGTYILTATDTAGCSGSDTVEVQYHNVPAPQATVSPPGPVSLCQGQSVFLNAGSGYTSYDWSNGATTATIQVNTPGSYFVVVGNGFGCTDSSATVEVNLAALPDQPVISQNNDTLFSTPGNGYQWYFNGSLIAGANARWYRPVVFGDYTVRVADSNGCTALSAPFSYLVNRTPDLLTAFEMFPNPAKDQLRIRGKLAGNRLVRVELVTMMGRRILERVQQTDAGGFDFELNLNGIAPGMYAVRIHAGQTVRTEKLRVQ